MLQNIVELQNAKDYIESFFILQKYLCKNPIEYCISFL